MVDGTVRPPYRVAAVGREEEGDFGSFLDHRALQVTRHRKVLLATENIFTFINNGG